MQVAFTEDQEMIRQASGAAVPAFTARLNYAASGLRLNDAGAQ